MGAGRDKTMRSWIYYWKHAVANILNNRLIHVISMGTIMISMLLLGAFILFYVNVNNWVVEWGSSLTMSVYLKDDISEAASREVRSALERIPGVEIKGFVSKAEAMADMTEALGGQAGLLEGLSSNPFPASFDMVFRSLTRNPVSPEKIKEELEEIEGVDEVQYSEQWLERFEGVIYMLKMVGFIVGGLLCVAVLFIVTNTIKLTIYSRRDEIEIFKLVGATDWFVKMPFLIEGAIQGAVSGLAAVVILYLIYSAFSLKTVHIFGLPVMDIVFLTDKSLLFIVAVSLLLGLTGSFIAIGRFFES